MIYCKKHIIAASFMLALPLIGWSEAPVVDDSENFAIINEQQAQDAPVVNSKYGRPQVNVAQNNYSDDDGPALAKDDQVNGSHNKISDSAALMDKIQSLQQEVQELRGQLEVQAHDLKLLQQQQLAFYKDLDTRLSGTAATKASSAKSPMDLSMETHEPVSPTKVSTTSHTANSTTPVVIPASRANPADEQISYLAAYELIKNRHFNEALSAMHTFVQKYPRGGYSANAQYWLGELYLAQKDNEKAIAHFDTVLQQFPTSSKSAASMLKVGYAYAAMGNKQEATRFLQQVIRAYPNTPTAQLATSKLQAI